VFRPQPGILLPLDSFAGFFGCSTNASGRGGDLTTWQRRDLSFGVIERPEDDGLAPPWGATGMGVRESPVAVRWRWGRISVALSFH